MSAKPNLEKYLADLRTLGLADPTGAVADGIARHDAMIAEAQVQATNKRSPQTMASEAADAYETDTIDGIVFTFGDDPSLEDERRRRALLDGARIVLHDTARHIHDYGDQHVELIAPILDKAVAVARKPKVTRADHLDAEDRWDAGRSLLSFLRRHGVISVRVGMVHEEQFYFDDIEAVHAWRLEQAGEWAATWFGIESGQTMLSRRPLQAPPVDLATAAQHADEWGYRVRTAEDITVHDVPKGLAPPGS